TRRNPEPVPSQSRSKAEAQPKETRTRSEKKHIVLDALQTGLLCCVFSLYLCVNCVACFSRRLLYVSLNNLLFKATKNKVVLSYGLLYFTLFNLSNAWAQSPDNRETAERQAKIKPLQVGDTIPEEVWNMPLQVVNHSTGKDTITLTDYR